MDERPDGMVVRVDHDGLTWELPRAPLVREALVGLVVAGVGLGLVHPALLALAAGAIAGLALGVGRGGRVRVDVRALADGHATVRLDDLGAVSVSTDPRSGRSALVVDTVRGDRLLFAVGQPRDHLEFFLAALRDASAVSAAREAVDGREWWFLRKAPDAVERLRGS